MANLLPYLIEASDLETAAQDPTFALRFPRLIEQLVRASLPSPPAAIRFPSFDTGQVHGFDAYLDSSGAAPYVPSGRCIFEFKTSATPRPDAEADYAKRKLQIAASDASSLTFVFITSHSWPGKGEDISQWAEKKRKDGHFKDVKVLDATAVVGWLHQRPAVALYGARHILRVLPRDFDAQDISEFAAEYEASFAFPLPPAALLAGRSELATSFREGGIPVGLTTLLADEEEEAAAFVCSALMSTADTELQNLRLATSLVLSDLSSARALDGASDLNLMLIGPAKAAASRLSGRNSVVACRVFGEVTVSDAKSLDIPNLEEFVEALSSSGKIDRDRARDLAIKNGRCLTILKRNNGNGTPPPTWAMPGAADRQEVRAATLVGAWSEAHGADRAILELLTSSPYPDATRRLRSYTGQRDSLLVELDRIWALRAPVDAFSLLSKYIGADDLQRFREAVKRVFEAERDQVPDADEIYDPSRLRGHSERLKTGLAQNVLLISALGDVLGVRPETGTCRDFASEVVKSVPNLNAHPGFLVAFGRQLPYLAEAAPDAFLDALEPLLGGDKSTLEWFLTPYQGRFSFFSASHVHSLIWALELIAWIPAHFDRVCNTLARLAVADLKVEATGQPRPLYSLQSILAAWAPQTAATLEARMGVVRNVARNFPEIAAPFLFELLPGGMGSVGVHSRPRFANIPERVITYGDIWKFHYCVIEELVRLQPTDVSWFREITTHLHSMRDDAFDLAISSLAKVVGNASHVDRIEYWKILRAEVARHQQFFDADWAMAPARVSVLDKLRSEAEPEPAEAASFLFDEDSPDLGIRDWKEAESELRRRRQAIVLRLVEDGPLDDLVKLAKRVAFPHYIASAIQDIGVPLDVISRLFDLSVAESSPFSRQLSRVAYQLYGHQWIEQLSGRLNTEVGRLALGALIPDNHLVHYLGGLEPSIADSYWRSSPVRVGDVDGEPFKIAIENWSRVGRDLEVIEQITRKTDDVPSDLLLLLVSRSTQEILASKDSAKRFNTYTFEIILSELDGRGDVSLSDIARLEWPLMPALYLGRNRKLAIHKLMATSSEHFIEIISLAYRASGSDPVELSDDRKQMAENAGKVLVSFNYSPYLELPINVEGLTKWIRESADRGDRSGHGDIVRIYIGHVLAHAPVDADDGLWPHRVIRGLLERTSDSKIASGIATERFNMRGAHSDSVEFYRRHAEEGRAAAEAMGEWPAVRSLLLEIAASDLRWSKRALRSRQQEDLDNSL